MSNFKKGDLIKILFLNSFWNIPNDFQYNLINQNNVVIYLKEDTDYISADFIICFYKNKLISISAGSAESI